MSASPGPARPVAMALLKYDSMEELIAHATLPPIDSAIPVLTYLRTASQLLVHANAYRAERNPELLYIYLRRFTNLLVTMLPKHTDWDNAAHASQRKALKKQCMAALTELEDLHGRLRHAYEYLAGLSDESSVATGPGGGSTAAVSGALAAAPSARGTDAAAAPGGASSSDTAPPPPSYVHVPLRIGTGFSGTGSTDSYRSLAPAAALATPATPAAAPAAAAHAASAASRPAVTTTPGAALYPDAAAIAPAVFEPYQPAAVQQQYLSDLRQSELAREAEAARQRQQAAEAAEIERQLAAAREADAERERTEALRRAEAERRAAEAAAAAALAAQRAMPSVDDDAALARRRRSKKAPAAPADEPLRSVVICMSMLSEFLRMAAPNTARSLEFCGILCGVVSENVLYVTTLVLPKQEATSDTVHTTNEEELWAYQMENDLLTLGWIHTHPTQQCFMSSVDVHTHCAYQSMLEEAIAIVMAPSHTPNYGIFQLTTPKGLKTVQECRKTGFHPHPSHITIYDHARHVMVAQRPLQLRGVDLRPRGAPRVWTFE